METNERKFALISFSDQQRGLHDALRGYLASSVRLTDLLRSEDDIEPGEVVADRLLQFVEQARVAVVLLSPEYLRSDGAAWQRQGRHIVDAYRRGELIVFWMAAEQVAPDSNPFADVEPFARNGWELIRDEAKRLAMLRSARRYLLRHLDALLPEPIRVFVSYNGSDRSSVRELCSKLKERGFEVRLDLDVMRPGVNWSEAVSAEIAACHSALICIGGSNRESYQATEIEELLSRASGSRSESLGSEIVPVVLPGAGGLRPALPSGLRELKWADLRDGLTPAAIDEVQWAITGRKPRVVLPLTSDGRRMPLGPHLVTGMTAFVLGSTIAGASKVRPVEWTPDPPKPGASLEVVVNLTGWFSREREFEIRFPPTTTIHRTRLSKSIPRWTVQVPENAKEVVVIDVARWNKRIAVVNCAEGG